MKRIDHRIAYYLRKLAQRSAIHPVKKPPRSHTYRNERLMAYKAEMHRRILSDTAIPAWIREQASMN